MLEQRAKDLFGDNNNNNKYYYNNSPTSYRDIISDSNYHLYYSD
jgi:hypothetical protein